MEPPEPASTASTKPAPRVASSTSAADRKSKLASLLASIDADLDAAAPAVEDDPGVNAFRRAKFLFPKFLEEQRKAQEAKEAAAAKKNKGKGREGKEVKPAVRSSSPSRTADHDTKRAKVSHESHNSHNSHDDDNADIKARLTAPREGSRSSTSSPLNSPSRLNSNRRSRSPTDSLSPSPTPRSRLDKGKGNATTHSVNAEVVYTNANANSPPSKSTRQQTRSTRSTAKDPSVVVIDSTDDSDSDDDVKPYRPIERRAPPPPRQRQEVTEAVDPEFAEYIQRAKDKAAKARKEAEIEAVFGEADVSDAPAGLATFSSNTTTTTNPTTASQATTTSMGRSGSNLGLSDEQATPTEARSPPRTTTTSTSTSTVIPSSQPAPSDQQYRVFITSHLPQECPPLLAFMRMDQEMRHARNAYLSHATKHNVFLSDDEQQSVLLTWKGSKIYNFTTGQSLNVKPDHKGRFCDFGSGSSGEITTTTTAGFQNGGLHLEIWTQQLYDAYLEDEERRRRRNLGELVELSDDDDDNVAESGAGGGASRGTSQAPEAAAAAPSTRIRLVLASREYEKLKITAHSDTTVETLATAFRLQRGIEPDKTVAIMWDGDELEGSMTVGEAEMEDLDSVEVYIR